MTILAVHPVAQTLDAVSIAGAITFQTAIKRGAGRGAMHAGPAGAGTAAAIFMGFGANGNVSVLALSDGYATFHFRADALPASGDEPIFRFINGAATNKMSVHLRSDGKLEVYDRTATLVATGTTVLSASTWYRIAVRGGNGAAAAYEVYIAADGAAFGAAELSGTCDQGATALDRVQLGKSSNKSSQTMSMYFQDLVIDNAQIWNHYHIGIGLPRANGANTAWTGDYQDVDEFVCDEATTEITSGTSGHIETYLMTSGADLGIGASDTINAVSGVNIRVGGASNEALNITFVSGASTTNTSNFNCPAAYAIGQFLKLLDPSTAAAWTRSGFDAIEVGCKLNSAFAAWVSSVMAYVMFTPTASGFIGASNVRYPQVI